MGPGGRSARLPCASWRSPPPGRVGGHVPAVHDEPLRADRRGGRQLLGEQLAAGDPDPVVGARDVDQVRRVDVDSTPAAAMRRRQCARVPAGECGRPSSPAGRRGRTGPRPHSLASRRGQRIALVDVSSDADHASSLVRRQRRRAWLWACELRPRRAARPGGVHGSGREAAVRHAEATPTKPATMPVTMSIRSLLVAETSWLYRPTTEGRRAQRRGHHVLAHDESRDERDDPGDQRTRSARSARVTPAVGVEREVRRGADEDGLWRLAAWPPPRGMVRLAADLPESVPVARRWESCAGQLPGPW